MGPISALFSGSELVISKNGPWGVCVIPTGFQILDQMTHAMLEPGLLKIEPGLLSNSVPTTAMHHFEVHDNEQSPGINVLDVPLCLLNQLYLLCLLCGSLCRSRVRVSSSVICTALLFAHHDESHP